MQLLTIEEGQLTSPKNDSPVKSIHWETLLLKVKIYHGPLAPMSFVQNRGLPLSITASLSLIPP